MRTRYPTLEGIVAYHREIMLLQGQSAVLIARDKLESAVARPQASAFGEDLFTTIAQKSAALLQAVAIAHPFLDGNKRAALGAMLSLLEMNGVSLDRATSDELYELVIAVTTVELREIDAIAERIEALFLAD